LGRTLILKRQTPVESHFRFFAEIFVRKYWETVKNRTFQMPPDEPVDETIEELLSRVSHEIEVGPASAKDKPLHTLRMVNTYGDSWLFRFRNSRGSWELVAASAQSDGMTPHDLLGPVYARYFGPFLRHVTDAANDTQNI